MAGSCEHSNDTSGSIKGREFLDEFSISLITIICIKTSLRTNLNMIIIFGHCPASSICFQIRLLGNWLLFPQVARKCLNTKRFIIIVIRYMFVCVCEDFVHIFVAINQFNDNVK
jgi:hypothetical protein